jgi:hypothetical protein
LHFNWLFYFLVVSSCDGKMRYSAEGNVDRRSAEIGLRQKQVFKWKGLEVARSMAYMPCFLEEEG